jgi:hypothetical protein
VRSSDFPAVVSQRLYPANPDPSLEARWRMARWSSGPESTGTRAWSRIPASVSCSVTTESAGMSLTSLGHGKGVSTSR